MGFKTRFLDNSIYIREAMWKYRKPLTIGLLALVGVDLLEIIPPLILKRAVDLTIEQGPERELINLAILYFAITIPQAIFRYGWRMYLIKSSMLAGQDLRGRYAAHLFKLPSSFYDRNRIGDLMSHATTDTEAVRMAIGHGLLTFADALFYILSVPVVMFWLSPKLTLLALIPLPIIPFFVMRNEREIHNRFKATQDQFSQLSAMAQENLNGVRVVKAFACEDVRAEQFGRAGQELIRLNLRLARVQASFGPMLDFIMSLGLVLLLFVGGRSAIEGAVTIGTFVAFQRYIQKMVWPMMALGMAIAAYQRAVASTDRLKEIFGKDTDVPDRAPALQATAPGPRRSEGRIEFRNLNFKFPGSEKPILHNISLTIESGMRVAFVGSIGSGKSALVSTLPRLYPVADGQVFLDGTDINDWSLEELRRQMGYVSQEVFLFSESVTGNLALALPVGTPDLQAAAEAATRAAAVHDDMLRLPQGYETRVGERGVTLSGGQKQRLSIARALLRQPPVLILDDALSSVDVQTERGILRGLRARAGRNTEVIAAHRVSTVREADRIYVLDRGKIIEQGNHRELVAIRDGLYARFHEQQRLKEDLENYVEKLDSRV